VDLLKLLNSLEETFYAIAAWMVLLPKTLIKVTLYPQFIIPYIRSELNDVKHNEVQPDQVFEEYLSPVLLWIFAVAVPNIYIINIVDRIANVIGTINPSIGNQINSLEGEGRIIAGLVFTLLLPIGYIIWIDTFGQRKSYYLGVSGERISNHTVITRSYIRDQIQIQCYIQSAAQIPAVVLATTIGRFFPDPALFSYISFIVLAFYEAFVLRSETGSSWFRSIIVAVSLILVYFLVLYIVALNK